MSGSRTSCGSWVELDTDFFFLLDSFVFVSFELVAISLCKYLLAYFFYICFFANIFKLPV